MGILERRRGFTIVELAIVISVIAILAVIVIVSYRGISANARDSARKSDLHQIATAIGIYNGRHGNSIETGSGCGMYGGGSGWMNAGPGDLSPGMYPRSIVDCLKDDSLLKDASFVDPTKCIYDSGGNCGTYDTKPATAYMKATCKKDGVKAVYVFAHLERSGEPAATIDALCDPGSINNYTTEGQKWGTHYGMNYYVQVL